MCGVRFQGRIGQQGGGELPLVFVLLRRRQAATETVGGQGHVVTVEPITRVVAVVVQGLAAQHLRPGVPKGDPLPEGRRAQRQGLHPDTFLRGSVRGQLVHQRVEQGQVVVRGDVGECFLRLSGVPGRFSVVVDLCTGQFGTGVVDEGVVGQGTTEPDLDPVLGRQQRLALFLLGAVDPGAVGVGVQATAKALGTGVLVTAATTAYRIAQPVVEGADTGPGHVELGGLLEPQVVLDLLTEVPPFPVQVDRAAVHAVLLDGEPVQCLT